MIENVKQAFKAPDNNGVRIDETEIEALILMHTLPKASKMRQLVRADDFVETLKTRVVVQQGM